MQTPVRAIKVKSQEFFETFITFGQCKSDESRTFKSMVSGKVDSIGAKEGQFAKAGEVIMTIDKNIAETMKSKAEAAFKSAELSYDRIKALFEKKVISKEDMEKAKVLLESTRSDLTSSLNQYNNMVIRAPFDGEVGVVMSRVGEDVKPGDYLFSLIANDRKIVILPLPEVLKDKVSIATEIYFIDSNGKRAPGQIMAVSPYLTDSGVINIKVAIDRGENFTHGSYLNGHLIINKHKALGVPELAVLKNDKGNFIYKVDAEDKVSQVFVKTGIRTNGMIEIIAENIQEGDSVILEGLTKVQDGAIVKIMEN
jgi:RND family efflux transporter MFP subunit